MSEPTSNKYMPLEPNLPPGLVDDRSDTARAARYALQQVKRLRSALTEGELKKVLHLTSQLAGLMELSDKGLDSESLVALFEGASCHIGGVLREIGVVP